VGILLQEWGMTLCHGVDAPTTKELASLSQESPEMTKNNAFGYCRAAARVNFMALGQADLSVASKLMSQTMSTPLQGTKPY
jgi:hypothetical protein